MYLLIENSGVKVMMNRRQMYCLIWNPDAKVTVIRKMLCLGQPGYLVLDAGGSSFDSHVDWQNQRTKSVCMFFTRQVQNKSYRSSRLFFCFW